MNTGTDTVPAPTSILCGLEGHRLRFDPREVLWDEIPLEHTLGRDITITVEAVTEPRLVPARLYRRYGDAIGFQVQALIHRGSVTRDMTFYLLAGQTFHYAIV